MGMKQTCWRPATQTETKKSIGKKRLLYEWTERVMQLEDSVSIFTKRFKGPAKTFEPSTIRPHLRIWTRIRNPGKPALSGAISNP